MIGGNNVWMKGESMKYCPNCGIEVGEEDRFCRNCGAMINNSLL